VASRRWWWLTLAALVSSGCSATERSAETSTPAGTSPAPSLTGTDPTGVPGLTVDDPFCSAWAGYVGTLQALGIAASFGDLPSTQFAALELTAAPRLVEVAAAIDALWPVELVAERSIVIDQRIGPYARRASRGVDALRAAEVTDAELGVLRSDWHAALLGRDPEVPVIEVPAVSADLRAKLEVAARAFDSAVTPYAQDPSLVVDGVATPASDAYLVDHCPDLASSGVGDAL
jgi:hypothetical protein